MTPVLCVQDCKLTEWTSWSQPNATCGDVQVNRDAMFTADTYIEELDSSSSIVFTVMFVRNRACIVVGEAAEGTTCGTEDCGEDVNYAESNTVRAEQGAGLGRWREALFR